VIVPARIGGGEAGFGAGRRAAGRLERVADGRFLATFFTAFFFTARLTVFFAGFRAFFLAAFVVLLFVSFRLAMASSDRVGGGAREPLGPHSSIL
jgi:hypothetical protein